MRCRQFLWGAVAALSTAVAWCDSPGEASSPVPAGPMNVPAPEPSHGLSRWFNPETAPFIPVPLIDVDPNSGTTIGLIPTWVQSDENQEVRRIIAPDVIHNPYFGYGVHGRVFAYSSKDEQWNVVAGVKERVEREFDGEYQSGRLRERRWSFNFSVIYDRNGTARFYGLGNHTLASHETNYTAEQELAQVQVGLNLTHAWQLLYTARYHVLDVLPGTLSGVASIQRRFPNDLGTNKEMLNRLAVVYDTRDDPSVPTRGVQWLVYGGLASRDGFFDEALYSEAGLDGRVFQQIPHDTVFASHLALHYLPAAHAVPFWALSSLGGGAALIGGEQPLRGYGEGRYYDRNSLSISAELRHKVASINAVTTKLDIEVAPFIDLGHVFANTEKSPLRHLHRVYGVGFRGIARPFVVGYVDVGYGQEGVAVFTGLNYPF